MPRSLIAHVDMDAFFTSVEQNDNPALRGRPVMVGGSRRRGVIAAASYEAREYGVRSAMPAVVARRLCPDGHFLPSRFERYREVSATLFDLFGHYSDAVEGVSLDEAYLDLSSFNLTHRHEIERLGRQLKSHIAKATGLTASVGLSHNKLLAKIASDYDKPDGLVFISDQEVQRLLDPLPLRRIPGIGPKTAERLQRGGLLTVGQLRLTDGNVLNELVGDASELLERARGIDKRSVNATRLRRSVSQETTFDKDHRSVDTLKPVIWAQAQRVSEQLKRKQLLAKTVQIKIRSSGFSTLTRSQSLPTLSNETDPIASCAFDLLCDWASWRSSFSIRLLGVGVSIAGAFDEEQTASSI